MVRLAKAHVPPRPVDKVHEDATQEVHEQYAQRMAPKVRMDVEIEIPTAGGWHPPGRNLDYGHLAG